jgi:hypothetical protein
MYAPITSSARAAKRYATDTDRCRPQGNFALGSRLRTRDAIRNAAGGSRLSRSSTQAAFIACDWPSVRNNTTIALSM